MDWNKEIMKKKAKRTLLIFYFHLSWHENPRNFPKLDIRETVTP
jgi:hypothetical protein